MVGITNRGKSRRDNAYYRGQSLPTTFYLALVTNAVVPTADTNKFSELTEIALGNGYGTAGGVAVARNTTDFDVHTEDDALDRCFTQLRDYDFTASGGQLPPSGAAYYAVLLDDNATVSNRDVLAYWSLGGARFVSDGQTMKLADLEIQSTEAP